MQRQRIYLVTLIYVVLIAPTLARSPIVAQKDIAIYDGPRSGPFCAHGEVLGTLRSGSELAEYDEVTSYCGFFRKNTYIKYSFRTPTGKAAIAWVRRNNDDGSDRVRAKGQ